ncbi:SDR family NAD(P)-dependent oxidoreductase [Blastococcus saxobsidens]|uniref:Short-chain dehydrogenase/reductase SDR n=1 Tax=Blastococcus saxobsidens (strain DD2) TaxID=1146883 RepID=H6RS51_BLASD|nr:SDR family NAD(P)-dependent oxidoreductase [Blastococcus saxobsidens]CCG04245.1 short-chain dehydrogenase/reductase SDR [Blastococcus saxobsidens DD2]
MPIPEDTGSPLTVLVTGGSSGIGRATAVQLGARGFRVVLVARGREALEAAADEVRVAGAAAVRVCPADVLDEEAVAGVVAATVAEFGRLDVVVHSAQVMAYGRIEDVPKDVYERVVATSLNGTATVARQVLPVFRRQHTGHLVVVNSLLGTVTTPLLGSYAVAKWGQLALARVLQQETRDEPGISVSIVQPGGVDTPIYVQAATYAGVHGSPPPPVYSAERAARRILSTMDRPRRVVQAGVFNPLITAGFRLLPGVYDVLVEPLLRRLAMADEPVGPTEGNVFRSNPAGNAVDGRSGAR